MPDPTGHVVTELRTAASAWPAPFTDRTVRGLDLLAEDIPKDGTTPKAIVVRRSDRAPRTRVPVQTIDYEIRCYDPDPRDAAVLAGLVVDAFHLRGPRTYGVTPNRVGIYISTDGGGSGTIEEPVTRFVHERVRVQVKATAQVIA